MILTGVVVKIPPLATSYTMLNIDNESESPQTAVFLGKKIGETPHGFTMWDEGEDV